MGPVTVNPREQVARVAVNVPLGRSFDYLVPSGMRPLPGCRVRVPFGRQSLVGVVIDVGVSSELPVAKLKPVSELLDKTPLLNEDDLWLINFVSDYYHHPVGEVAAAALPALLRQGRPSDVRVRKLSATPDGLAADLEQLSKRAPKQSALLESVVDAGELSFAELDELLPGWRRIKKSLLDKALLQEFETSSFSDDERWAIAEQKEGPPLNPDQQHGVDAVRNSNGFSVTLLDGVTGSGKTEVYLHLIRDVLDAGKQALVLVPEIGLTPQLVHRLRERLGIEPALLHSGLTDHERLMSWRAAKSGAAGLVVGTRSAVFVPLANPGIVVIDEEHDASLKQQEGLRYSARDLAVLRGKRLNVPVVLGSATPSLESLKRCKDDAYQRVPLPSRAGRAVPPHMRIVDLLKYDALDGLSQPVLDALQKNLDDGHQALIYLNRRGYAPTLICTSCGMMAECNRCDSRMTVHAASRKLCCHHCGAERAMEDQCAHCGAGCRPLGLGTERLEDTIRERFPDEKVTRIDSDSTRGKGKMSQALSVATSGESRILVGTQMLSKGHHFPSLTLVVVVNADQGLFSTDFRGAERLAQSLVQVAGRAGREQHQGEVIIQTAFASHPFWNELFTSGYEGVAAAALAEREATMWPPCSHLALLRASALDREHAREFLGLAAMQTRDCDGVRVLGPVRAPMERKAGRYRAQLLLQSVDRSALHAALKPLRSTLEASSGARKVRWSIDVDPIELF